MIEVKKNENKDACSSCTFAEYDAEGKHCNLNPLTFCRYRLGYENECEKYRECVDKEKEEEQDVHSGITLDLEKISFADLKRLEYMVDEELKSRRSELDALIEDFRKPLEALLSSNKVSIYCNVDEGEIKSFFDFSFCEK